MRTRNLRLTKGTIMEVVRNKVEEHVRTMDVLARGYAYVHREQQSPSLPGTPQGSMYGNPKGSPVSARVGGGVNPDGFNPNINISISNNNSLQQAELNANMGGMAGAADKRDAAGGVVGTTNGSGAALQPRALLEKPAEEKKGVTPPSSGEGVPAKSAGVPAADSKKSGKTPASSPVTHFNIGSPEPRTYFDIEHAASEATGKGKKQPPPASSGPNWFDSPDKPVVCVKTGGGAPSSTGAPPLASTSAAPGGAAPSKERVPSKNGPKVLDANKGEKTTSGSSTKNPSTSGSDSSSSSNVVNGFQRKKG